MKSKREQLSYLLKSVGSVTVESISEIIELVPVYGPLVSKIISKILYVCVGYEEEKMQLVWKKKSTY